MSGHLDRLGRRMLGLAPDSGPVTVHGDGPEIRRGTPLTALVWNVQFAAGRDVVFFYDGGRAVRVPADTVERVLDGLAAALREHSPDLVLLQEVDRKSRRTAFVDEHAGLLARVPYPVHTSVTYWRARFVPWPLRDPLGPVDLHLSVFSRFRIREAHRWPLARLAENRVKRAFNLRRAVLETTLPIAGGGVFTVFDTHLSAWSRGDGTLPRQVGQLAAHVARVSEPWLLAGDLNAIPPGDDPRRLPDPEEYPEADVLAPLIDRSAVPRERLLDPAFRTYLPPRSDEPDRVLDHAFLGGATVLDARVLRGYERLSDHLPLLVRFSL